ncbi:hypothetical protein QTP70_001007 [Hemibagrus guttatus]|uniref:Uncharacterized protein n=1 Tax=Hemibagrus guttatus TaxID=175788 RepID=A0AAE0V7R1_9TELE|nr:hypothetical protein QTP70_001007 [Hemibagrus guttatus]
MALITPNPANPLPARASSVLHWWKMHEEDAEPTPGISLEHILKHLLETSIHQQVASQEVAQSLELATKELQELRRGPHAVAVPLPEPGYTDQEPTHEDDGGGRCGGIRDVRMDNGV